MNPTKLREDFPALHQEVHGKPLVYLDNAATAQKPKAVIDAISRYYMYDNANVHRGIHALAERATVAYEGARARVAQFIGAPAPETIIFTKNASEAINMVAYAWGAAHVREGDEIVTTPMEHHSNLIPWQQLARRTRAKLRYFDLTPDGRLDISNLDELINERTRIVAVTHISNVLGTINPVQRIAQRAHEVGAVILVDGAQSVPHMPVNVQELDCDFLAFSGHKMGGPMGIGVLYGKPEVLEEMDPFLFGGEMISKVTLEEATWKDAPHRFEAGTPNVAGVIGLGAAVEYLEGIGMDNIWRHEVELSKYCIERMRDAIPEVVIYGPEGERAGLVCFNVPGVHPHDLAQVLDREGVAIRAGHHCAQPLMRMLQTPATARASTYLYNTKEEIDIFVSALIRAKEFFA